MTNIWTQNGNRVAALAPGPGDLVVLTTIGGRVAATQPIREYQQALDKALAFAAQTEHPIKVLPTTLTEAVRFCGITPAEFVADLTDEDMRRMAIEPCLSVLRESSDPKERADALEILTSLGVIQP